MASNDIAVPDFGNFNLRRIAVNQRWFHVEELLPKARDLQTAALLAKATGKVTRAIELYTELLPFLAAIDAENLVGLPPGLQAQVAEHTIAQLEALNA